MVVSVSSPWSPLVMPRGGGTGLHAEAMRSGFHMETRSCWMEKSFPAPSPECRRVQTSGVLRGGTDTSSQASGILLATPLCPRWAGTPPPSPHCQRGALPDAPPQRLCYVPEHPCTSQNPASLESRWPGKKYKRECFARQNDPMLCKHFSMWDPLFNIDGWSWIMELLCFVYR